MRHSANRTLITFAECRGWLLRSVATFELHPVSREAHVLAMARCGRMGLVSGAIFDAVIMAAAEESNVDAIVTFNVTDFERFRAEGSPRIVLPPEPPAVAF